MFRGKRKIKIWQLQRHDREYYKSKNKKGKTGNVRRDVQMYCKGKKDVLLGVEVMFTLDYTIPVKMMDYNVQELQRQIKDIRQKNKAGKKSLKLFPQDEGGLDMCKALEDEREEGREEGILVTLCSLVRDGLLKLEDAAKRANMSEEMFGRKMQEMS